MRTLSIAGSSDAAAISAIRLDSRVSMSLIVMTNQQLAAKKNPRQPCQRGFPKSELVVLGKALVRLQRFQKRSASCP